MAQGAAWIAAGTLVSRILGLVREVLIVAVFPRMVTDAFFVALRLPNMFRRLLGEGSLSVAFIPVFVETLTKQGEAEAKKLASGVFSLLMLILTVLTIAGIVWMRPLIEHWVGGEGYASIPGKLELTVQLAQIIFAFIFLMSIYAFFMAILQSFRIFGLPAVAPALLNVFLILAMFVPENWFSIPGEALAWAVIVGGGAQAGVLIPRLIRLGYFPRWVAWWKTPAVKKVLWTMLPSMAGMGILQLTGIVNVFFASKLAEGAHSYIYLADRILELPLSLFAVSLGSSLLPTLSRFWAAGQKENMLDTTARSLRLILFVSLPCTLGMWILSRPITEVVFKHGNFTAQDVEQTAAVIRIYGLSLIFAGVVRVVVPAFYAMKNTWLPAAASGFGLIVHLSFVAFLLGRYGLEGLVYSTILGSIGNLVFVFWAYKKFIGRLPVQGLAEAIGKFLICCLPLGLLVLSFQPAFDYSAEIFALTPIGLKALQTVLLFIFITLAGIAYFAVGKFLQLEECRQVLAVLSRKTKKMQQKTN